MVSDPETINEYGSSVFGAKSKDLDRVSHTPQYGPADSDPPFPTFQEKVTKLSQDIM